MLKFDRTIIIVADSVGVGEMPDSSLYGDVGCNTLGNIARAVGGLHLPNMEKLGIGNIIEIAGVKSVKEPTGYFAKMHEESKGKDTTTGHWEIAGLITEKAFPTYPDGFPMEIIEKFEKETKRGVLGNYAASGTEIIANLGEEHMKTGKLIVYTSADSVFQVAAHEEIVPVSELYRICEIARGILTGEHAVSRIISRPFLGKPGSFYRTENRKDFSLKPPKKTLLNFMQEASLFVMGIGKIEDIFEHSGLTDSDHTGNNLKGLECLVEQLKNRMERGLIFVNLVDFDMVYGHRNNVKGYAEALQFFDGYIPKIIESMNEKDLLMITADHGCDPTVPGTDHTREYVPLIVYSKAFKSGGSLGLRESFADIAATIVENYDLKTDLAGKSFMEKLK